MSSVPRKASIAFICFVLALSIYRAATQSFSIDEAYTYQLYIDQRIDAFFKTYDACNHVLHSLLTKLFRGLLGRSELVLRISSLIGALLYLWGGFRLTELWFGTGWIRFAALAAISLNPLLMDFFVASRGYGLALGLLLWSLYHLCLYFGDNAEHQRLWRTGVLGGLAVAANLTVAVPVAVLGMMALLLVAARSRARLWIWLDGFAGPALITAFLILVLPLSKASSEHFYYGTATAAESLDTLVDYSLRYDAERSVLPLLSEDGVIFLKFRLFPILALLPAAIGLLAWLRVLRGSQDAIDVGFALTAWTFAGSVIILGLANRFAAVRLPYGRTGLYLILLFMAMWMLCARWLGRMPFPFDLAGHGALALTLLLTSLYAAQLNTTYFVEWRADASINKLMAALAADHGQIKQPVQLSASWEVSRTVELSQARDGLIDKVSFEKLETTQAVTIFSRAPIVSWCASSACGSCGTMRFPVILQARLIYAVPALTLVLSACIQTPDSYPARRR
ncbi:MAG: hypothetical protein WKF37_03785 [Bryobacteraceae bacterium]